MQAGTYDLWFRRRYNLSPTDPRYLEATDEQILTDFWAQHYDERRLSGRPEDDEFEDESFDQERVQELMLRYPGTWMDHLDDLEEVD